MTLKLDAASFAVLAELRARHFPAERNWLPAHLTLLHTVSSTQRAALLKAGPAFALGVPPTLAYAGVRFLGRGVALEVLSPGATTLRSAVMNAMGGPFTRQDLQPFRAHVTVQNKVSPELSRQTFDDLRARFVPWTGFGLGLLIWRYLGGPWEFDSGIDFSDGL